MDDRLLTTNEAARRLGTSRTTLYDWLAQSDASTLRLRGQPFTIDYFQGGPKGQGRIMIEESEINRIKEAMRVRPRLVSQRRMPTRQVSYPGIHVKLGRPEDN
jgi:excisionase family DNA binding protein